MRRGAAEVCQVAVEKHEAISVSRITGNVSFSHIMCFTWCMDSRDKLASFFLMDDSRVNLAL